MTDLEMTRLCAEAMELPIGEVAYPDDKIWISCGKDRQGISLFYIYAPLSDDVQAMVLVKRFRVHCQYGWDHWGAQPAVAGAISTQNDDLNRAIVECVAKMQQAKTIAAPIERNNDSNNQEIALIPWRPVNHGRATDIGARTGEFYGNPTKPRAHTMARA